jgi:hypothetical protein
MTGILAQLNGSKAHPILRSYPRDNTSPRSSARGLLLSRNSSGKYEANVGGRRALSSEPIG